LDVGILIVENLDERRESICWMVEGDEDIVYIAEEERGIEIGGECSVERYGFPSAHEEAGVVWGKDFSHRGTHCLEKPETPK
jgi:hypothetical protein